MLQKISLKKQTQNQIVRLFKGNAKNPGIGARTIARQLGVPHRQVMTFLQQSKLATYSEGSYA